MKKRITESIGNAINQASTNDLTNKVDNEMPDLRFSWGTLDDAIHSFNEGISELKHIGANLWQTDISEITSVADFEGSEYEFPSLDYWTIETNVSYIKNYDEAKDKLVQDIINRYFETSPYGTSKMGVFWRDDNFLDAEDLKEYYHDFKMLDSMIDQALKNMDVNEAKIEGGKKSAKQIKNLLKTSGYGDFSLYAINKLIKDVGGYKPMYMGLYFHPSAVTFIFQNNHLALLRQFEQEYQDRQFKKALQAQEQRQSEDDIPFPYGYNKGMTQYSQELLDDDEIDYARWNRIHRNESVGANIQNAKNHNIISKADDIMKPVDVLFDEIKKMIKRYGTNGGVHGGEELFYVADDWKTFIQLNPPTIHNGEDYLYYLSWICEEFSLCFCTEREFGDQNYFESISLDEIVDKWGEEFVREMYIFTKNLSEYNQRNLSESIASNINNASTDDIIPDDEAIIAAKIAEIGIERCVTPILDMAVANGFDYSSKSIHLYNEDLYDVEYVQEFANQSCEVELTFEEYYDSNQDKPCFGNLYVYLTDYENDSYLKYSLDDFEPEEQLSFYFAIRNALDDYLNLNENLNENLNVHNGRENALDNRNSDGQEVQEPGEYSTNVYLKDCPFLLGKENVEFFKLVQAAKERHTITSPDDFIKSAKMNESAQPLNEEKDLSDYGEVQYSIDFDEDFYDEWLNDEELSDTPENRERYAKEECMFDIVYLDNVSFHDCGYDNFSYDQLINEFGERIGEKMFRECMKDGKGSFETCCIYDEEDVDINNPESLNKRAKQVLSHGNYYSNCRGFILTDGDVVYTPSEHNQSTHINGVKGTNHFISLGNIRLSSHGLEIQKMPTEAQFRTLQYVVSKNSRESLYVDLIGQKQSRFSREYQHPNYEMIERDIINYFSRELTESVGNNIQNASDDNLTQQADFKIKWGVEMNKVIEGIEKYTGPKQDYNCINISEEKFYDCGLTIKGDTYFPESFWYEPSGIVKVTWFCCPDDYEDETGVYMPDVMYEDLPWWENPESLRDEILDFLDEG